MLWGPSWLSEIKKGRGPCGNNTQGLRHEYEIHGTTLSRVLERPRGCYGVAEHGDVYLRILDKIPGMELAKVGSPANIAPRDHRSRAQSRKGCSASGRLRPQCLECATRA
jgi:hypothetical protein